MALRRVTAPFCHVTHRDLLPRCSHPSAASTGMATLHLTQNCNLSSSAADVTTSFAHTPYALIQATELALDSIHHQTHLPWWAVIVGSTLILRGVMTLPLAIYQAKMVAKRELLMPRLRELQEWARHSVVVKCRKANKSHIEANRMFKKEAVVIAGKLFREEGVGTFKLYLMPWVQIPLWVTLSYALRNMTGFFSDLTSPFLAGSPASMAGEGVLWFPDLTAVDPYMILPVVLAATNLLNIELHSAGRRQVSRRARITTNMLRVLCIAMGYISTQMPSAVVLYWSVSSSSALIQNTMLMLPKVRRTLDIPKVPSEKEKPFRFLLETVSLKTKAFLELQKR